MAQIQRYDYIDTLRGGAMIAIILWHSCFLSLFYAPSVTAVPLFFMISGLFYKEQLSWKQLLVRNVKLLLVPYLAYNILCLLLYNGLYHLGVNMPEKSPMAIFYTHRADFVPNVATWYLLVLFWVVPLFKVLLYAASRIVPKWRVVTILAIVLVVGYAGYIMARHNIHLPMLIDIVPLGVMFYGLGYLISTMPILQSSARYDKLGYWLIVPMLVVYIVSRGYITMAAGVYDLSFIRLLVMMLSLFVAMFYLCKIIGRVPIVTYIGRYSLIALCTHMMVIPLLMGVAMRLFDYDVAVVVSSVATILLLRWCVIPSCIRFMPVISGIARS